jgi:hypothetical protein
MKAISTPVGEFEYIEPAIHTEEDNLAIREFCVRGLAESVPEFINREQAENLVSEWFPADRLALASLYRQIAENQPLRIA